MQKFVTEDNIAIEMKGLMFILLVTSAQRPTMSGIPASADQRRFVIEASEGRMQDASYFGG